MQSVYSYVPKANHVSRVYCFAAILYLQFMLDVMLFPMLSTLHFYISIFWKRVCIA